MWGVFYISALSISRLHVEFHQLHSQPNDSKLYWQIKDPGSASGVFVNKHRIPKNNLIRLNDGDIIGVGGNFKEEDIWKSSTKPYLLKVVAPDEWGQEQFPNDNNEDNKGTSAWCLYILSFQPHLHLKIFQLRRLKATQVTRTNQETFWNYWNEIEKPRKNR